MSVRMLATAGTVADCTQAEALLDGIAAEHLLADRGYDTNKVLAAARARGMAAALPPKRNRKVAREYDRVFARRAIWWGMDLASRRSGGGGGATRYAKNAD